VVDAVEGAGWERVVVQRVATRGEMGRGFQWVACGGATEEAAATEFWVASAEEAA
jgi:hypothetical protein